MFRDPVCGREIEILDAKASTEYYEQTYYFCSKNCKQNFDRNPQVYVQRQTISY